MRQPASGVAVQLRRETEKESQTAKNMKKSTTKKPAPKAKDLKPTKDAKGGAMSLRTQK